MTDRSASCTPADLHIGMENYGQIDPATGINGRVMDFLRRFSAVIDYALDNEVDLFLFAGDAYKTRDPNSSLPARVRTADQAPGRRRDTTVLLGGEPRPAQHGEKASSVEIFRTLEVPNVLVGSYEHLHRITTRRGETIQLATVPYPVRQRLLVQDEHKNRTIAELDAAVQQLMPKISRAWRRRLDPALPGGAGRPFQRVGGQLRLGADGDAGERDVVGAQERVGPTRPGIMWRWVTFTSTRIERRPASSHRLRRQPGADRLWRGGGAERLCRGRRAAGPGRLAIPGGGGAALRDDPRRRATRDRPHGGAPGKDSAALRRVDGRVVRVIVEARPSSPGSSAMPISAALSTGRIMSPGSTRRSNGPTGSGSRGRGRRAAAGRAAGPLPGKQGTPPDRIQALLQVAEEILHGTE